MRQLLLDKRNIVVKKVAQPLLSDYSILVAVHYAYISNCTNMSQVNTQENFLSNVPQKVKRVLQAVSSDARSQEKTFTGLGYPCTGHVISVGKKVQHVAPGDLVACADPGYTTHSDLICIPEWHAVKISDSAHLKSASLTTFAAVALHGLKKAHINLGERIAVFGLGLLGQFVVQLAKLSGCTVVAFDDIPERLVLAQSFGADHVYNIAQEDVQKEVSLLTERQGVDAAIVTQQYDLELLLKLTKPKARVVLLGISDMHIPSDEHYHEEQEIILIPASGRDQIPYENLKTCLAFIEQGRLDVATLVQEEIDITGLKSAYKKVENKMSLGMLLTYDRNLQQTMPVTSCVIESPGSASILRFIPAVSDAIKVGLIGAGEFAQKTLLPLISKMRNVQINAIVDSDMRNSARVSSEFNVSKACMKEDELFKDNVIDVVMIASPHVFHCDQAIKALKHGKAVFLEKPMVTDFAQLLQLCTFLKRNSRVPFVVDYNRSFAPFMKKIKKVTSKRNTPLMMNYRINTEYYYQRHQSGSGHIIGEACQIIDLFYTMTNSKPISVSVEAMHAARDDIFPTDNFSVHISFNDGSIGTLLFTSLGHADMGSERFELFYDEKSIVMEDFMELYGFGLPSWFNETVTVPDKGHEALLSEFFQELRRDQFTPPISIDRLHLVSELTLLIDQLACEGGGTKEIVS